MRDPIIQFIDYDHGSLLGDVSSAHILSVGDMVAIENRSGIWEVVRRFFLYPTTTSPSYQRGDRSPIVQIVVKPVGPFIVYKEDNEDTESDSRHPEDSKR